MSNGYLGWTLDKDNKPVNVCLYKELDDGEFEVCALGWEDKPFKTKVFFYTKEDCVDHLLLLEDA